MAKILRKIPHRKHGKYTELGSAAEDVLSKIQDIKKLTIEIQNSKDLTDDEKRLLKDSLDNLALICCTKVSYYNANGLNTFQNAEKTGLTQNMTQEQIKILKKISNNVQMLRILFATGRCSGYIMLTLSLCTLYIQGHYQFLYNIIQPEEIYIFLSFAFAALYCFLRYEKLSKKMENQIEQLVNINTR